MSGFQRRTFDLSVEDAELIDRLVAAGAYESEADVVSAGLLSLKDHQAEFELWLEREVVPAYDAVKADPSSVVPAEEVFAELRARHEARFKGGE